MKKIILLFTALCAIYAKAESLQEFVYNVGDFNKLEVLENINVVHSTNPDSIGIAVYRTADDSCPDCFYLTTDRGRLKVQSQADFEVADSLPTLYVYSSGLQEISNASNGETFLSSPLSAINFKAELIGNGRIVIDNVQAVTLSAEINTGNGTIVAQGNCTKANLKMLGTGTIQADRLKADEIACNILGTGAIGCWATDKISIHGMGSTTIYVKGNPKINKRSLGGKIVKITSADD